jgi:hypothetical protein
MEPYDYKMARVSIGSNKVHPKYQIQLCKESTKGFYCGYKKSVHDTVKLHKQIEKLKNDISR